MNRVVCTCLLVLFLQGCSDDDGLKLSTEFSKMVPSRALVWLDVPGTPDIDEAAVAGADEGTWCGVTVDRAARLNDDVGALMGIIDELASNSPDLALEDGYQWGPTMVDGISAQVLFTLVRDDGEFQYELKMGKTSTPVDEFSLVVAGGFTPGTGIDDSEGIVELYFDQAAAFKAANGAEGEIIIYHNHAEGSRQMSLMLSGFCSAEDFSPAFGTYEYVLEEDDSGSFEFSCALDYHKQVSAAGSLSKAEQVSIKARWKASGRGRADVTAKGGDLAKENPPVEKVIDVECWDDAMERVYFKDEALTPAGESVERSEDGDPYLCAFASE